MSSGSLTNRDRAQTHGSIRKRMLRSSSQSKYRDLHRNSTMSSFRPKFQRLLQEGKVDQILNTDPHSKANLFYTTHINQLQKQLAAAKKSLSTMVVKSKGKQYNINKIKNDINKMERDCVLLRDDSALNNNKFKENKDKFAKKQEELEDKVWVEKSYSNMNARLEKDEDSLKIRHDRNIKNVQVLIEDRAQLETKYYNLCQLNKKLKNDVMTARNITKEQTEQKNQFIELLNQQMAEKDLLEDIKQEKKYRDHQINDIAQSLIEKEELQKYKQIMFTHRLVSEIIKAKNQKLMAQYEGVQKGYLHIKSNTNITQMNTILDRMEKQDEEYEKLLKKVAILEQQLLHTDREMEEATQKQFQILSMDTQTENKINKTEKYNGMEKDKYELNICDKEKQIERNNNDQILKKKITLWVQEHAKMYDIDIKVKSEQDFFTQLNMLANAISKSIK